MKNKIFKLKNIMLIFLLCFSFVFSPCILTGCLGSDDDTDNKPGLFVTYKPYASKSTGGLSGSTYGKEIFNNILSLSVDILTELVYMYGNNYSEGEISVNYSTEKSNGVDLKSYLNITNNSSNIDNIARELNNINYVYYISAPSDSPTPWWSKALILSTSNITVDTSDLNSISKYKIADNVYRISEGYYIFTGGSIGGVSYVPNSAAPNQTSTAIAKILNTNYNVIEKDYRGIDVQDSGNSSMSADTSKSLSFAHWNYSKKNNNYTSLESPLLGGTGYLNDFIAEFGVKFCVHVASTILFGNQDLSTGEDIVINIKEEEIPKDFSINSGDFNFSQAYKNATKSGATESDQKKFIEACCIFIDHFGITQDDAVNLYDTIKKVVIGEDTFNKSENDENLKNNYDIYIKYDPNYTEGHPYSVLNRVFDDNKAEAVLAVKAFSPDEDDEENTNTGYPANIEDFDIDGYLNSIVFICQGEVEVNSFMITIKEQDRESFDMMLQVRYCDGEDTVFGFFSDGNAGEEIVGGLIADVEEILSGVTCTVVDSSKKVKSSNFVKIRSEFVVDDTVPDDQKDYYHAWTFEKDTKFVEFVFASHNMFDLMDVDIEYCSVGY